MQAKPRELHYPHSRLSSVGFAFDALQAWKEHEALRIFARLQKKRYIGVRFTFSNCRKQKAIVLDHDGLENHKLKTQNDDAQR